MPAALHPKRLRHFAEISSILDNVYEFGYFHGDLHSKNIILNDVDDHAYLIDFGTSIFSGKEASHNRDATMLFELVNSVLPEVTKLIFLNESIIGQGSKVVKNLFSNTIPILWFLELEDIYSCDDRTLMENIILPIENLLEEYPFIDKSHIILFYQSLRVNYKAYEGVIRRTIKDGLNAHKYLNNSSRTNE